jgi:hypothetical protein
MSSVTASSFFCKQVGIRQNEDVIIRFLVLSAPGCTAIKKNRGCGDNQIDRIRKIAMTVNGNYGNCSKSKISLDRQKHPSYTFTHPSKAIKAPELGVGY